MKSKFLQDFKQFAMRGNVVDMAVGIIIGGAFGKIVSSAVSDLIMPVVGILLGGVNFTNLKITLHEAVRNSAGEVVTPAVTLNYGNFIQVSVDFIIIAFSIFLMIKLMAKLMNQKKKEEEAPAPTPEPSAEVKLLTEIRDLMEKQKD
ncbi:large-conductance mechanosensitive channel protein MscL [Coprobacter tertius]|uniref:Large-conductance mechanosensitive channel n=1 Tax=Coprobacter tertius TaxID=2944915 RepID=A0ABT1MI16_9BACT|nr:large-conductance mechanosensitive channel protein MscL [Coprobacter tertius]MCP9612014.1 large-conductance mechanosensitive channel protein MscL [Coprobacter tertius]